MVGLGRIAAVMMTALALGGTGTAAVAAGVQTVQYRGDDRGYGDRGRGYDERRGRDDDRRGGYDDRRQGGGGAPGGTYLQSCGQAQTQGSTLSALCRDGRGRTFETSIDLSRCGRSDIGNAGGTLNCAGARGSSRRVD